MKSKTNVNQKVKQNELDLLFKIFQDLESRIKDRKEINKEHFGSIIPLQGLWNERLYILFDYHKTEAISLIEFLAGMAQFTKDDTDDKIRNLFRLYDMSNKGYIEKLEFMKMLFNYPKNDIGDLYDEIRDINTYLVNQSPESMVVNNYLQSMVNVQHQSRVIVNQMNSLVHQFQNFKTKGNSKILKVKKDRKIQPLPTTMNNKLKIITNIIYLKYGKNDKLFFEGFQKWISLHIRFLNKISQWFRTSLWESYYDRQLQRDQLSFHRLKPELQSPIRVQNYNSISKTEALAKVYDIFLFVFYTKNNKKNKQQIPDRVVVIKGLEIKFKDHKKKIYMNVKDGYKGTKIQFDNYDIYKQWKTYFEKFAQDIKIQNYQLIQKIGKGKFSIVHQAKCIKDGKLYAMKIIQKQDLTEDENKVLINETKIMKVLSHPNIVRFQESWESHTSYNYVIELIQGEDLYSHCQTRHCVSERLAFKIFKEILEAVDYLHHTGIIHRDLKPENIMINYKNDQNLQIKLIDFGFSIFSEEINLYTLRCGTPNFVAPEIIQGKKWGFESDIFSLGVILYFMLSGILPFDDDDQDMIAQKTVVGDYDINDKIFENISEDAKDLIKKMLIVKPEERITIKEIRLHDWMSDDIEYFRKSSGISKYNSKDLQQFIQLLQYIIFFYFCKNYLKNQKKQLLKKFIFSKFCR